MTFRNMSQKPMVKNKKFFHHYDSFDEESQKLLDFIISHMHDSVYIKKEIHRRHA